MFDARTNWDSSVSDYKTDRLDANCALVDIKQKVKLQFQTFDFYEKQILFSLGQVVYCYQSHRKDSETDSEEGSKKWRTKYDVTKLWRDECGNVMLQKVIKMRQGE